MKWQWLMEKDDDPDLQLILPMIKSKEDWYRTNMRIGFTDCKIDKIFDEYPAPDVDKYPYDGDILRWMGGAVIAAWK